MRASPTSEDPTSLTLSVSHNARHLARNIFGEVAVGKVFQFANIVVRMIGDVHFTHLGEDFGLVIGHSMMRSYIVNPEFTNDDVID
jgi:hypothetical protein